jgi:hypothetical protein
VRAATRNRRADGAVSLDPATEEERSPADPDQTPELSVLASGCLGLVSFPRLPGRVPLERIEADYPGLVETLRRHPGVGFVLVRSELDGALALGPRGVNYLDLDRVDG